MWKLLRRAGTKEKNGVPYRQAHESLARWCIHKYCRVVDSRRKCCSAVPSPSRLACNSSLLSSTAETVAENRWLIFRRPIRPAVRESKLAGKRHLQTKRIITFSSFYRFGKKVNTYNSIVRRVDSWPTFRLRPECPSRRTSSTVCC